MSLIIYKIRDKKRINKCGKHLYGWKNSIPLGLYTQKSLIIHRCLYKLTSVFQSQDCSKYSYQKILLHIIRRTFLNGRDKEKRKII